MVYWKKSKSHKELIVIGAYCFFSFSLKLLLSLIHNTPVAIALYASFTFFEYLFFAAFLYLNLKSKRSKQSLGVISILFCLFIIIYYLTIKFRINSIDSIPIGVETIIIIGFSFYYLFEQMNDTSNLFIYSKHQFWILLGILLYLAGSFFIYIFAGQLKPEEIAKYWIFTNIFSILKNLLFVVAILVNANHISEKNKNYQLYNLN